MYSKEYINFLKIIKAEALHNYTQLTNQNIISGFNVKSITLNYSKEISYKLVITNTGFDLYLYEIDKPKVFFRFSNNSYEKDYLDD